MRTFRILGMKTIEEIIKERILVLDGGLGTMIQKYSLSEKDYIGNLHLPHRTYKGNNDMLCLTRPDIIEEIAESYLKVGADMVSTCTFSANAISLSEYGMEDYVESINRRAVEILKSLTQKYTSLNPEKPRFVAGSVGPTNKSLSISPKVEDPSFRDITYDMLKKSYEEQMETLILAGVDVLVLETFFDTLNAKVACDAAFSVMERVEKRVPVMLSITLSGQSGRTLSGQNVEALLHSVEHYPLFSFGFNCSFGAEFMKPFVKELSGLSPYWISLHPNAGLPNAMGGYDETPQEMMITMEEYIQEGLVNIVGGCCGTTPEHIALYQDVLKGEHKRFSPIPRNNVLYLSGLDSLSVKPQGEFIKIGERCNVAGSRKFLRLIKEERWEEAVEIARGQVEMGAKIIDINMDDGMLNAKASMVHFLHILMTEPEVCRVPIMIDSSDFEVIEAGLKCVQGKCIVNSISLKEGEEVFLHKAEIIRRLGAAVVVMAFDEKGQADTFKRRIEICHRAYKLLTQKLHYPSTDIIFDPNILAIATGMEEHRDYAKDYIRTAEWIKKNLPNAHIVGGVSNLSFALRGNNVVREYMNVVFLHYAVKAGMDMGIVNPSSRISYEEIPEGIRSLLEDVIWNTRPDATERLLEGIHHISEESRVSPSTPSCAENRPVKELIAHDLIKGDSTHIAPHIEKALLEGYSPYSIVDKLLMPAMQEVGTLFGEGKMFLPQVVKTARTMKSAVAILRPKIEAGNIPHTSVGRKKILMATVKGDVHDIGKNIVDVILSCNGYEVIDLGVMIPSEEIIKKAVEEEVVAIGVAGLITPSLNEMCIVAKLMQEKGLKIPLLVGGAATSQLHTALKIDPLYDGVVLHIKDASILPPLLTQLFDPLHGEEFAREKKKEYCLMREDKVSSLRTTSKDTPMYRMKFDWSTYIPPSPKERNRRKFSIPIEDVLPLFNWRQFFSAWNFEAHYADIVNECRDCDVPHFHTSSPAKKDEEKRKEAITLYSEALHLLHTLKEKGG
ncbi:MAG TPA: methionine synthase, partial [Porphyromonadaceae bacterium]|nr:methionine synthase [Porphyromonadaceae bacterium]